MYDAELVLALSALRMASFFFPEGKETAISEIRVEMGAETELDEVALRVVNAKARDSMAQEKQAPFFHR